MGVHLRKQSRIALFLLAVLWILPVAMNCGGEQGTSEDPQNPITIVISGRITTPDGSPLPGIAVYLIEPGTGTGGAGCGVYGYASYEGSTFTGPDGYYSFGSTTISGSLTIRPSSIDFTFVPDSVSISIYDPNPNMDFVAHPLTGNDLQISTGQAEQIKVHSAILTGSFNPDDLLTSASFQWGIDSILSDAVSTSVMATASSSITIPFESYLDNLSENSTYYYRAIAANSVTTKRGGILSFTTLPLVQPSGSTDPASNIKAESARISGTVNAHGSSTSAWFEWGQDPVLATYNTDGLRNIGDEVEPEGFYHDLYGLTQSTTYYYRAAASNEAGVWKGSILSFTTPNNPLVITQPATLIDSSGGTFNGTVENFGYDSTVWFMWATDPSMVYEVSTPTSVVAGGVGAQLFSSSLSGMAPSTRYYFRAQASTYAGAGQGEVLPLTTHSATGTSFWSRTYGGSGHEKAVAIRETGDGGYGVAGWTWSFDNIWVMKLRNNGDIQWQRSYGGYLLDDVKDNLRETSDGGYILAGQMEENSAGGADYWILRLDENGEILWQRTYGGTGFDIVQAIQETTDGGFIAAGYTQSFGAGDLDIWIVKLDADGVVQWQKALGMPSIDFAYSVETLDNGFVIGAHSRSGLGVMLIKVGNDGTVLWNRSYGSFEVQSITRTDDGGYILAGGKTLIKTDSEGILQWQKSFEGTGYTNITAAAHAGTTDCLIGGYTNSFNTEGPYDAFVVKLDNSGDILWQKAYGGTVDDRIIGVLETSDGSVIAAGYTSSFGVGDFDSWVLKLASDGSCPPLDRNIDFAVENITNSAVDAVLTVTDTDLLFQDTTAVPRDIFFIPLQQAP